MQIKQVIKPTTGLHYIVIGADGIGLGVGDQHPLWEEVESYILDHPEALVPEPVPPESTQEELDAREIQTLTAYLASTDWYATRLAETGKAIPTEILSERQAARDRISELKEQA